MCVVLVSWWQNFNFKFYFDITIVLCSPIESLIVRLLFINYMYITKRLIIPQLTFTRAVIDRGPIFVEVRLKTKLTLLNTKQSCQPHKKQPNSASRRPGRREINTKNWNNEKINFLKLLKP